MYYNYPWPKFIHLRKIIKMILSANLRATFHIILFFRPVKTSSIVKSPCTSVCVVEFKNEN